jgi:uncharacterized membrane protein YoaK (UPF0700 family)
VTRYDRRVQALAVGLSMLAGYVDATGFMATRGYFVAFMSGNSTRFAVGLAAGSGEALFAGGLIAVFIVGVVVGSLVGNSVTPRRPAVLALVTALLAVAAALAGAGANRAAIMAMGLAMGAENATFEHQGDLHIGLTYMTGTLVKAGQRIAAALMGGDRLAWLPFVLMWAGLVAGAVAAAAIYPRLGLGSLWLAAGASAVMAVAAARIGHGLRSERPGGGGR